MKTATMFMGNITQIDFAYIDLNKQMLKGGSLNLSVEVTGPIEEQENVVVDFGSIKRTIKSIIDDKEEGYDHKLWVTKDFGDRTDVDSWVKPGATINKKIAMFEHAGQVIVATPSFMIYCPKNAIKIYDQRSSFLVKEIEEYLEFNLNRVYQLPISQSLKIRVYLTDTPLLPYGHTPGVQYNFRYVHGLRQSTSWGCQNIAHGHLSWLLFLDGHHNVVPLDEDFKLKMDDEMNDHIFIWKDNVSIETAYVVNVDYQTFSRGYFNMSLSKEACRYQVIETETTVEHLVDWFVEHFQDDIAKMVEKGATRLYFSEGLVKGACVSLKR